LGKGEKQRKNFLLGGIIHERPRENKDFFGHTPFNLGTVKRGIFFPPKREGFFEERGLQDGFTHREILHPLFGGFIEPLWGSNSIGAE